jgi:acyl-CoA synthetase (AMP-forming)/AMP-acid ligase II
VSGSLATVVAEHARNQPEHSFLIAPETGRTLTYAQFSRAVAHVGDTLAARGIAQGEHVGFLLQNGLLTTTLFIGIMAQGRVAVPLNLLSQGAQLAYVLEHSRVRCVYVSAPYLATLRDALARLPEDCAAGIAVIEVDEDDAPLSAHDFSPPAALTENANALLMYTSGTTGQPKGAMLTHGNLLHTARTVTTWHALTNADRVLSSLPLYHINGQCIATLAPFISGGSIIAPHKFSVSAWWDWVRVHEPTWINVVPTIIAYLLNANESAIPAAQISTKPSQFSGIRFARSASAPLPPDQHHAFERAFGIGVIEAMGMTECASMVFCNPQAPAQRKYGTPGLPCGVEVKVMNAQGETLGAGETGELCLRGANVMQQYFNAAEKTAEAFDAHGWLRTGDLGHRDADGFYFVTGRIKELIIKGGENIAPREIDEALLQHEAVLEAAAYGVPDKNYGQTIHAAVVLKAAYSPDTCGADLLISHCIGLIGKYKAPSEIRFLRDLPKGPSGKVQRLKLSAL